MKKQLLLLLLVAFVALQVSASGNKKQVKLRVTEVSTSVFDETSVNLDLGVRQFIFPEDGQKIFDTSSSAPALYSFSGDMVPCFSNSYGTFTPAMVIPLGLRAEGNGLYMIRSTLLDNFDPTSIIRLEDRQLSNFHDLRSGDYTFLLNQPTVSENRFFLHVSYPAQVSATDAGCSNNDGTIFIQQDNSIAWTTCTLYDDSSNVVYTNNNISNNFAFGALSYGQYHLEFAYGNYAATNSIYVNGWSIENSVNASTIYATVGQTINFYSTSTNATDFDWNFGETVLFGHAHMAGSGRDGFSVMTMADDAEICGCNGVCKGAITKAIAEKKLFTLDEVRAHTKASASCGSCTGLVEQLLAATVGTIGKTPAEKPMCKCTENSHDRVRAAIREQHLTSLARIFEALNWKNPDGCHSCRPALNYYLISTWPSEAKDDQQSRFINERVHANIQKDGTYSVVPRMWGGLTNPQELRAIADVADKFQIPTVKVTGGQRIDLLGVKKEDLPKVWADLNAAGMVSGHAYGKSLRTVKTCVGTDWCRFGTQDSTGLGVKLEKMTWGSWTPHKFKMAVSGCPRNCAEATIKDFGVVCVDSGYEIHVGGNGGIKIRGTDLLCKLATEAEVKEYCCAFMQLYREEGRYLERTAPWIERVGLGYIKSRIVEDEENRQALCARFLESQQYAQIDPWAERANGRVDAHEFQPLQRVG